MEPTLPEGSAPGTRPARWPDCRAQVGRPGSCCATHRGPGWPEGLVQVREVFLGPAHLTGDSGPPLAPVPLMPRPLSHSWAIPGGAVAVATPTDGTRTGRRHRQSTGETLVADGRVSEFGTSSGQTRSCGPGPVGDLGKQEPGSRVACVLQGWHRLGVWPSGGPHPVGTGLGSWNCRWHTGDTQPSPLASRPHP